MFLVRFPLALLLLLAPTLAAGEEVRVATLVPYVSDALEAVSDEPLVVASVRASMHAPAPAGRDLGSPHEPNLEALATARPTLVVADDPMHRRFSGDLARGGAEILWLDGTSVDATFAGLRSLGETAGVADAMERRIVSAEQAMREARLPEAVPVLALFGAPGSFFVVTERAWLGDLLTRVGFELVGTEGLSEGRMPGFAPVSDEHLATLRPELVVLVAHGDPAAIRARLAQQLDGGPWASLGAAATRGVHVLDGARFAGNPGLELPARGRDLVALALAGGPVPAEGAAGE